MSPRLFLALLPVAGALVTGFAVRPRAGVADGPVGARRLTVIRVALLAGGFGVVGVEALSRAGRLNPTGFVELWLGGIVVATLAAGWRWRIDRLTPLRQWVTGAATRRAVARWWHEAGPGERALALTVAGLLLAELVLALASAPNTYDSQTYHLPKIEHWAQRHSVEFFATNIHRQVTFAPGAEYLLLHLRELTGSDALYGLLQFGAGLVCLIGVTRITAQLGGGRRAQLLAAFVVASTPLVVLESSSTQTDLVVAAWVTCLATLVVDGVAGPAGDSLAAPAGDPPGAARLAGPTTVVLLGVATGLIAMTKQTGLLAAAPLLLWWGVVQLRRAAASAPRVPRLAGVVLGTLTILGITVLIAGPYVWRLQTEFGHPLGPEYVRTSVPMQRHDPAALLVNGLRQAHTLLDTPIPGLNRWSAGEIEQLSRALGVDPQDPAITFDRTTFPDVAWYPSEDKAAFPVQALLIAAGVIACLFWPRLGGGGPILAVLIRRRYASVMIVAVLLYVALVKWQPWGNRLVLYVVVVAAPLAGLAIEAVLAAQRRPDPRRLHRLLAAITVAVLMVGGTAGGLAALYGWPRSLLGSPSVPSVFTLDRWHSRFVERPSWADDFADVGAAVRRSGARRIGIVQENDTWEYPWWVLFRGRELVALQTQLPHHRPVELGLVDAVVCQATELVCSWYAPPGWRLTMHGVVGYILPPPR